MSRVYKEIEITEEEFIEMFKDFDKAAQERILKELIEIGGI